MHHGAGCLQDWSMVGTVLAAVDAPLVRTTGCCRGPSCLAPLRQLNSVPSACPPHHLLQLDFVKASSYGSSTISSGDVLLSVDMAGTADVAGRHILLVSSIFGRASVGFLPVASLASLLCRADLASSTDCKLCLLHLHRALHTAHFACCTCCITPPHLYGQHMPVTPPRTPNATAPHTARRRSPLPDHPSAGLGAGGGPGRGRRRRISWRVSSASVAQSERGRA